MTWYVYFSAWTFSSSLAHRQGKKALYPLTACINLGDMCLASTPRHYVWDTVMGGVRSTNTPVQLVPRTLRGVSALDKGKIAGLVNVGSILSTSLSKRLGWDRSSSKRTSDDLITFSISIGDQTCLQEPGQFLLSVEDHDHKWRSRNVFSTPFNLNSVVPGLCRFVFAQDGSIFLRFTLHFHSKSAWKGNSDAVILRP